MYLKPKIPLLLVVVSMAVGVGVSPIAGAQAVLEEVVVTARRYAESITDAPVAVNVMDANYLQAQGVQHVFDILELTPGATWGEFAAAQPSFTVRGVTGGNLGNASLESAFQLVVDGIPQTKAFMMTPPPYDLERVEIMRGPQGTTFGRNATLGIMHFVTAKPQQEFDAQVNTSFGERSLFGVDGFITGPLSDNVSVRLAFRRHEQDGDMEDENTGAAIDAQENTAVRASLLFEPSDNFSAYVKGEFIMDDDLPNARRGESSTVPWLLAGGSMGGGPAYINEYTANADPWKMSQSIAPPGGWFMRRDMVFLTGQLQWQLDNDIQLTSLTGFQDGRHHTYMDVFGAPEVLQDQEVRNEGSIISTELRIDNSASGDAMRWLAGIYLQTDTEDRLEYNRGFPERGNGGGRTFPQPPSHWITESTADTNSVGLFGELSFDLSDSLNLTVGGRYTDDSRDYLFSNKCSGRAGACGSFGTVSPEFGGSEAYNCANPANRFIGPSGATECGTLDAPMGIVIPENLSNSWDNFSANVSLSYAVNDNNNIYALYSEGFKAGGFQHDARNLGALHSAIVDSEEAENLEFGWKGSYDRARFALTIFQQEQINAQANALVPVGSSFTTSVLNYGGVETDGIEFEYTFLFGENFMLGGNIATYDGVRGPNSFIGAGVNAVTGLVEGVDVSGTKIGLDETWVLFGSYDFHFGGGSKLTLRADIQHRSGIPGNPANDTVLLLDGSGPAFDRPEIDNVGASLTWTSANERTVVSLWGQNLTDEYDWKNIGPAIGFHYNTGGYVNRSGMGIGSPGRGYSGRQRIGLDARFNFGD
jgi:iron complex outermembrane recepter protein